MADVRPTELVEVSALKPHPRNYKKHPPDQIAHIVKSIEEHGFYRNVVTARDYTILAGHGVVEAVQSMGLFGPERVPVIRLDIDPNDVRALKIMTSDNELGKLAETDYRLLGDALRDVLTADDLLGTGFDGDSLKALIFVSRPESEIRDHDAAAEWANRGMPEYESVDKPFQLVINFDTEVQRVEFMKAACLGTIHYKNRKTWSTWWPERRKQDLSSLMFDLYPNETAQ